MTARTIAAGLVLAVVLAAPAAAGTRKRVAPVCADYAAAFSLRDFILGTGPAPQPNGCAPPVYDRGQFIGQDPDPNIRLQLRRDSVNEGYDLNVR